jgi:AcrR family transcriptional regulator
MRATVEKPVLATGPVDGRSARRDRNKTAVLDAVLELFQEGSLSPGPVEVAQRCGLSPRSVYRYFDDADELVRAAVDRHLELTLPYFHLSAIGQGPRDERIDRFAERRVTLFFKVGDVNRAARLRAATSEVMANTLAMTRRELKAQVERHFAPEWATLKPALRRRRLALVDTLTQFETLDTYRQLHGMDQESTTTMVAEALEDLLPGSAR